MLKRAVDVVLAATLIVVLSPLLLATAIAVRVAIGRPVLFRQVRPGLCGRPFELCKFRTMSEARDSTGQLASDELRLTRFGRWLRRSSLDELPELFNVLKGDMSLVGPRPLLVEYLSLYSPEQARRHEVRPGITGWAQVNGRNAISWDEKLGLDVWYVDNQSLWLDVKILILTIVRVFSGADVTKQGYATTDRFRGSAK